MSVRHRRVLAVGVVAAAAVAVPLAALASGSGTPSHKPAPPAASKSAPGQTKLAESAGISEARLQAGLAAAKHAGASNTRRIAAFAAAARVSDATAQRIVHAAFGTHVDLSLTGPAAVAALAGRLGVSHNAARHALVQIGALSGQGGVNPASSAFRAIARGLGVSPARLAVGLDSVKEAIAGK